MTEQYWNQVVTLLEGWRGAPPSEKEVCDAINPDHRGDFYTQLSDWEKEGRIVRTHKGGIGLPAQLGFVAGRLQRNAKGFGFIISPEREIDVFIPANKMGDAMHGDQVLATLSASQPSDGKRTEGTIVRILQRAHTRIVGRFDREEQGGGYVTPDNTRIGMDVWVSRYDANDAPQGAKVVCEITRFPNGRRGPAGRIVEILGMSGDTGVDILSIIRALDLPEAFPDVVLEEARTVPDQVQADAMKGRLDLRDQHVVTIDGADAKDLDDAVSIQPLPKGGYRLGVHIADVSHYVKKGTALDREAYDRGTSVYLVDRVIPMLPHELSNGICSLHSGVNRLTLSCIMELDASGEVIKRELAESVICTSARMTYDDVNLILEQSDPEVSAKYANLVEDFRQMEKLADILRKKRVRRGAIDLNIDEPYIELNELGQTVNVTPRARGTAHKMIEEFMLCANETVAEWAGDLHLPMIYRIHEDPDPEKILDLDRFVQSFGYRIKGLHNAIRPKMLQTLLDDVSDKPEADIISRVLLRSLQKAKYHPRDVGHFGLAAAHYCHFTSPIRRYPDLIVHRVVKAILQDRADEAWLTYMESFVADAAKQSSERELVAMEAERTVDSLKMTEYMVQHIGEEFDGIISGVTEFGIFVELPSTIEGLIRINTLDDDYYVFDEKHYCLNGKRTHKIYRLGDPLRIRVLRADITSRQIDFELADSN